MPRRCCFDWRVWLGAGLVPLAVLVAAPGALGAVAPLALGLACPLSMLVMMLGMRSGGGRRSTASTTGAARAQIATLEAELAELRLAEAGSTGTTADGVGAIAGRRPGSTPAG